MFRDKEREARDYATEESFQKRGLYTVLSAFNADIHRDHHTHLVECWSMYKRSIKNHVFTHFTLPWSEHPVLSFYHRCVEPMRIERISTWVGTEEERPYLYYNLPLLRELLDRLASPESFRPANEPRIIWQKKLLKLLHICMTSICSHAELRKIGLPRNLTTEERFMLLHCLWLCRQRRGSSYYPDDPTRIWVFVDDLDALLDYSPREQGDFNRALASLFVTRELQLTLWLNISAGMYTATTAKVKNVLGLELCSGFEEDFTDLRLWGEEDPPPDLLSPEAGHYP